MHTYPLKAKLKAGETVIGCFVRTPDPSLIEFLGYQGWDLLVLDAEHGVLEPRTVEDMVRASELRGIAPIVRVTANQPHIILRFLDTGAAGVHVPWVNTGAEAEAAVQAIKYHPRGIRGLGGVRATDYGQTMNMGDYTAKANAETLTVIHIETAEAAHNIADILAVPDVDVVFVGTSDLSHSLGVAGQVDHPDVQAAVERVFTATQGSGVAFGTIVGSTEVARRWVQRGAQYVVITLEAVLGAACRDFLSGAR